VVQLDSPFISGWRGRMLQVAKATGLAFKVPPASIARQRRDHWPDLDAAARHFGSKPMFQRWDARVLADYLRHGFEPDPVRGGLRLAFHRDVETRIYACLPHTLPHFAKKLKVPVGFLAGKQSDELRQGGIVATKRFIGLERYLELEGTHLFPFEHPQTTAQQVDELLARLTAAR
jgi:pimeloyl-ACP methyl ester carboxylesterase